MWLGIEATILPPLQGLLLFFVMEFVVVTFYKTFSKKCVFFVSCPLKSVFSYLVIGCVLTELPSQLGNNKEREKGFFQSLQIGSVLGHSFNALSSSL